MEDKQADKILSVAQNGNSQSATTTAAPLHYATSKNEWYTPALYVNAVRELFHDRIELDPASCAIANETVRAERYITIAEDGLAQPWNAETLFLNPPCGRNNGSSQAGAWTHRLSPVLPVVVPVPHVVPVLHAGALAERLAVVVPIPVTNCVSGGE